MNRSIDLLVYGKASQKIIFRNSQFNPQLLQEQSLMEFLLQKGIPIASSCGGQKACQKCVVTVAFSEQTPDKSKMMSCEIDLEKINQWEKSDRFINPRTLWIEIDYL